MQATTSGVGVSKSPKKLLPIILEEKQRQEHQRTPRIKWEKSEYMNSLECLLKAEKKGIGKIVHDLWMEKGTWEIDEKNLMNK